MALSPTPQAPPLLQARVEVMRPAAGGGGRGAMSPGFPGGPVPVSHGAVRRVLGARSAGDQGGGLAGHSPGGRVGAPCWGLTEGGGPCGARGWLSLRGSHGGSERACEQTQGPSEEASSARGLCPDRGHPRGRGESPVTRVCKWTSCNDDDDGDDVALNLVTSASGPSPTPSSPRRMMGLCESLPGRKTAPPRRRSREGRARWRVSGAPSCPAQARGAASRPRQRQQEAAPAAGGAVQVM